MHSHITVAAAPITALTILQLSFMRDALIWEAVSRLSCNISAFHEFHANLLFRHVLFYEKTHFLPP